MKTKLHKLILSACLSAVSLGAAADQITMTVAAFPAVDSIVKDALVEWQKRHPNVEVEVVGREYADHHTAMTTGLAASSGLPDVMAVEYGYMGRFAAGGSLVDLSQAPYNSDNYSAQWTGFAYQQAQTEQHGQSGIPTDIGPGALFYRKDILDKAGVSEQQLTESWESFVESGVKIKQATGSYLLAHARDIKDIIIRADIENNGGIYFDADGKSVVGSSPRFKRAFVLAKQIRDNELDGKIGAWSGDWGESFKRGTVATQMMGSWLGGHLANWLAPDTKGLWRSASLPAGAQASWGGTFYAIPKQAEHKDLAWDLIQHLTLNRDQQLAAFESYDAFPALLSTYDSDFFNQEIAFLGGQQARVLWRDSAADIPPTRVFRHDPIAEELVNAELDLVLTRGKDIDAALADADRLISRRARR